MDSNNNDTEIPEDLPEEQALQLKVKDFSWRTKAKAKPLKKRPVVIQRASFRWMKGTGLVLNQEILSAYEVSKKVIHLLRHSQKEQREWWSSSILENERTSSESIPKKILLGLTIVEKHAWQQEERKRDTSTALAFLEYLFISELFKDIHDAILLILGCKKLLWFRADSCNKLTTLDVRWIFILSSTID